MSTHDPATVAELDQRYANNRDRLLELVNQGVALLDEHNGDVVAAQSQLESDLLEACFNDPERAAILSSMAVIELSRRRALWL